MECSEQNRAIWRIVIGDALLKLTFVFTIAFKVFNSITRQRNEPHFERVSFELWVIWLWIVNLTDGAGIAIHNQKFTVWVWRNRSPRLNIRWNSVWQCISKPAANKLENIPNQLEVNICPGLTVHMENFGIFTEFTCIAFNTDTHWPLYKYCCTCFTYLWCMVKWTSITALHYSAIVHALHIQLTCSERESIALKSTHRLIK